MLLVQSVWWRPFSWVVLLCGRNGNMQWCNRSAATIIKVCGFIPFYASHTTKSFSIVLSQIWCLFHAANNSSANITAFRRAFVLNLHLTQRCCSFRPYFELKNRLHTVLEAQREVITRTDQDLATAKSYYSRSMSNLESISNEIHSRRQGLTSANANNNNNGTDCTDECVSDGELSSLSRLELLDKS